MIARRFRYVCLLPLIMVAEARAGITEYMAFNLERCEHWVIELGGGWPPEGYERYDSNSPKAQPFFWTTFHADNVGASEAKPRVSGLCRLEHRPNKLLGPLHYVPTKCETSAGFPMSGATYAPFSKNEFFNFRCVSGCGDKAVQTVYTYFSGGTANKRLYRAWSEYNKKCQRQ